MNKRMWTLVGLAGLLAGCPRPEPIDPGVTGAGVVSPYMDQRLLQGPVAADVPPPAVSGGTLFATDTMALVSDPDRDRIVVVDRGATPPATIVAELAPGSEPGRILLQDDGRLGHAILRGSGEVYTFDPLSPATGERRRVCAIPRGLAYDAETDELHVACRSGELVTLPAATGAPTRTLAIEGGDLRDVLIDDGQLFVSRFRAAELVRVERDGTVMAVSAPYPAVDTFSVDASGNTVEFTPSVAWRTIAVPGGGVAMVHQRASQGELNVANPNAYYTTSLCNGSIIQSAVTFFRDGVAFDAPNLADASLAIDVAVAPDGQGVAVVNAGNQSGTSSVVLLARAELEASPGSYGGFSGATCTYATAYDPVTYEPRAQPEVQNAIAADFDEGGRLLVQQRNDADGGASLVVVSAGAIVQRIDLGGADVFDTGHTVFHGNAGRGTACASCHPEGAEDGRTWHFAGLGPRRTPAMHGDVTSTAPFHWDGDLPTLNALAAEVFTRRMGGPQLSAGQVDALGGWLDQLPAPEAPRTMSDASAQRGHDLFWGAAACSTCHSGGMLTNNANHDVGTGGSFQVPSLIGVSARLPVMHDGCATTLHERFRPDCGGDRHGEVASLGEPQIDDLVAYLETL